MNADPAGKAHVGDMPRVDAAQVTPDERPVSGVERLVTLDFIRGVAVLGILVANVVAFGLPSISYSWPTGIPHAPGAADKALWLVQYVFIDGKMRGLFTLLFGAGMVLFMHRAWARGATRGLQARRLVLLMGFGLLHFFFLFWGDILYLYSLSGLVALLMVKWEPEKLIRVGVFWYAIGGLFLAATLGAQAYVEQSETARMTEGGAYAELVKAWDKRQEEAEEELSVFTAGSYAAELDYTVQERSELLWQYPFIGLFETIPLMLIGMGLYGAGLFSGEVDRSALRTWGWIGFAGGAAVTVPFGLWAVLADFPPFLSEFVANGISQLLRLPMILGLAALLVLWAPRAAQGWLGGRLVAAGRMAFSNYIGTSVVMLLVFRHWAGGNFAMPDRAGLMAAVVLGWALMLGWSQPWLARYRYGPLEWLWRCLTYGRLFPMRK